MLLLLKAVLWCCGGGVVRRPAEVVEVVRWLLQSAGHWPVLGRCLVSTLLLLAS